MNSNTEWLPTKCRITKPPPPKPATNPLQFIRVTSCPLYQKAQEQIRKVEEVKVTRQDINDDAEEWQQNLDNWKSSRKKRQEHIIERVVEVKRLEEEEQERTRRKSKTFNEILQERNKRGHRLNIPLYDNSDDLSEYYISSNNDNTNCIRNSNEKDINYEKNEEFVLESQSANHQLQASDQNSFLDCNNATNLNVIIPVNNEFNSSITLNKNINNIQSNNVEIKTEPQYTYEGAIQDYRTRIKSKINIKSLCNNQEDNFENKESIKIQNSVSKIDIYKCKERFEMDKSTEIKKIEHNTSKKLLDEFVNSQSIKERLKSLEKCTDQNLQPVEKGSRLKQWNKHGEIVIKDKFPVAPKYKKDQTYVNINPNNSSNSSTETNMFMKKFDKCNKDYLDNCECDWYDIPNVNNVESMRLINLSSDQGTNTLIDNDMKELNQNHFNQSSTFTLGNVSSHKEANVQILNINKNIINDTKNFLDAIRRDADINYTFEMSYKYSKMDNKSYTENIAPDKLFVDVDIEDSNKLTIVDDDYAIDKSIIFDNDNIILSNGTCTNSLFPLAPPRSIEPPKEKPPPPPSSDVEYFEEKNTEQIKQELFIKRSSFLKLDESTEDPINSELCMGKDIDVFYQNETQLDRSEYKKLQGSFSEVDSQDSGLESERGRLSSDTWCSNFGDSSTPIHGRQDSEKTNSITSEEDEIAKKEREIIELVEKEEKSRNIVDYSSNNNNTKLTLNTNCYNVTHQSPKKSEELTRPDFLEHDLEYKSNFDTCNAKLKAENLQDQIEDNTIYKDNSYHNNRHSLDNICYMENVLPHTSSYRKSMPDIQNSLIDTPYYKSVSTIELQCCKSMPDIQKAHFKSVSGYKKTYQKITNGMELPNEHRKSMPELKDAQPPIYRLPSYVHSNKLKDEDNRTTYNQYPNTKLGVSELRTNPHLSTSYKKNNIVIPSKHSSSNVKNYSRHWLYHEAELRRIAQQTNNSPKRTWQQTKQIEPFTQNVISNMQNIPVDRNLWTRRSENKSNSDLHSYLNYSQKLGSASPVVYPLQEPQHKMLSVSGKKKCSYCENELGRGAAMIIESLCLFYHMECFKCCVCHTQLGDGLIGTDVRVRNQKLHCHNCYSSEDGIKLSCV